MCCFQTITLPLLLELRLYKLILPASPAIGDTYLIKDTVGAAAINNITVSGNGNNVDGSPAKVMTNNFEAIEVTYTGTQWSVS